MDDQNNYVRIVQEMGINDSTECIHTKRIFEETKLMIVLQKEEQPVDPARVLWL